MPEAFDHSVPKTGNNFQPIIVNKNVMTRLLSMHAVDVKTLFISYFIITSLLVMMENFCLF